MQVVVLYRTYCSFCKLFFVVVKHWLYSLLGTLAEVFPEFMLSHSDRLVSIYISVLKSQVHEHVLYCSNCVKQNYALLLHCCDVSTGCALNCLSTTVWCNLNDDFLFILRILKSLFRIFYFISCTCKTSQSVNILQLLSWSKFKVSKQPAQWMQSGGSFMLHSSLYHLMKQLCSCKNQWRHWEKNLKGLRDKVCGLEWLTSICLPWSEPFCL